VKKAKKTKVKTYRPYLEKTASKKGMNIELSMVSINMIAIAFLALSFALFPLLKHDTSYLHSPQNLERVNSIRNMREMRRMNEAPVWMPPAVPMQIWQEPEVREQKQIKPFE